MARGEPACAISVTSARARLPLYLPPPLPSRHPRVCSSLPPTHPRLQTLAALMQYTTDTEQAKLCNELGLRLELEPAFSTAATCCFLCAMNAEKVVGAWQRTAIAEAAAATAPAAGFNVNVSTLSIPSSGERSVGAHLSASECA